MRTKMPTPATRHPLLRSISASALLATSGLAMLGGHAAPPELPETIQLIGVARDFKERSVNGGHPDFELDPADGFGQYAGIVSDTLGASNTPAFQSQGRRVSRPARDAKGRNIIDAKPYLASVPGDVPASISTATGGAVTNNGKFQQWFKTVNGTNKAISVPLVLRRTGQSNQYVFDSATDPVYSALGGFFPINKLGYGNSAGDNKNYHFTYTLSTEFVYTRNSGQVFTFTGDDDVWVFIDRKLVIDLGGVHGRISQTIELDRLTWLQDGETYSLRFFFAERHRTESNFRIETTLNLQDSSESDDEAPGRLYIRKWEEREPG
ncbi:MAG: fibro-slime domain-containing protein [Phycisphaeraceae bacterium]|nr:fibro-slime domain-containing protein [Phycisphaeraceae bacterium]